MKLNLPALLVSLILITAQTFGQISITASDIWVIGDSIPRASDTMSTFLPGPDGVNQVWDCSGATTHVVTTTKVILPSATPYASSFASSNQAMTTNDSLYLYFNSNTARVLAKGSAGKAVFTPPTVTDFNFPLSPDFIVDSFPINYGNHYTDTYGYDAVVAGAAFNVYQARLKHFGTVYDTIVGWGTIKTNVGTYDCLKLKVVEHKIDSIWTKLFSFLPWTLVSATDDTSTSYSWLAKETKLAVAELTFDSLGNPKQLIWSLIPPLSTGISQSMAENQQISLFPNPSDNVIHLKLPETIKGMATFQIYDMVGREIWPLSEVRNHTELDVSAFEPGVYVIRIKSESGVAEQRFVKK